MSALYAAAMIALVAGAAGSLLHARLGALACAAGCVALAVVGIDAALGGGASAGLGGWLGYGHHALRADGLAGIFLGLTGVTGAAVSLGYAELPHDRRLTALHGTLVLFVAVAIGATNGFLFLLAWEALAVCIFLLASADAGRPGALAAGYLTAGLTKVGGAALLAALGLLYARTGSFDLGAWARAGARLDAGTRDALFVLFVVAFGTKVGTIPLQGALPAGYGAAPRAGAASLSVALCAGFYGLWRFVLQTLAPASAWWADALLVLGAITAFGGILYALTQDDVRRFLGFSTVEHAGIALVGFAVALLGQAAHDRELAAAGLLAATLHVVAHGLAKTLALLAADRAQQGAGERTIDALGGLASRLRPSSLALGAASLTLAAIPPLGGFVSEWFTFEALLQGFRAPTLLARLLCALAAAALAFTAGLGLLAFAKLLGFTTLGPARTGSARRAAEAGPALSVGALTVVVAFLGTVAPWEVQLLGRGLAATLGFDPSGAALSHPLVLGPVFADFSVLAPTWLSIVLPGYAALAALIVLARNRRPARRAPVWVTGSGAQLPAVQYRPSAYSNPIRVVLKGILAYRTTQVAEEGGTVRLETRVVLAVDRLVYAPLARAALAVAQVVRASQSGRLGDYLLYMLAALVVVLALVPILH
ncbi:MAG TPA: proton-conducting transporter membrane subunit [Solirubrobacteraceae bacterium]|nr:proton-conducting transporter membrane subunit [Solirubrobacteraceae bacterium]